MCRDQKTIQISKSISENQNLDSRGKVELQNEEGKQERRKENRQVRKRERAKEGRQAGRGQTGAGLVQMLKLCLQLQSVFGP